MCFRIQKFEISIRFQISKVATICPRYVCNKRRLRGKVFVFKVDFLKNHKNKISTEIINIVYYFLEINHKKQ